MAFESMSAMKMSIKKKAILTFLVLSISLITYSFFFERFLVEVKVFDLNNELETSEKLKVIQVSDLHLQSVNYPIRRIAQKINDLSPDLILLTGDAVDKSENTELVNEFLELLDDKVLKVAIVGNWEYWANVDMDRLRAIYTQHNCRLLINETVQYIHNGRKVSITGIDDYLGGIPDINKALEDYQISAVHIVLNHCPEYTDAIADREKQDIKIDLILSGHTHGGQINLLGFIPFLPGGSGDYVSGWYENAGEKLYVSKGVGTSILPIRFGSRAEVAVFYL